MILGTETTATAIATSIETSEGTISAIQTTTDMSIPRRTFAPKPKPEFKEYVVDKPTGDPAEARYAKEIGYPLCAALMAALGLLVVSDMPAFGRQIKKAVHTIYKFLACNNRDKKRKVKSNKNPLII